MENVRHLSGGGSFQPFLAVVEIDRYFYFATLAVTHCNNSFIFLVL